MIKYSYNKHSRLLSLLQYKMVFRYAYKITFQELIIFGKLNNQKRPRLGISISKKYVRKAYQRNYLKRLIREFFRLYQYNFLLMDFIVVVKKNISKNNGKLFLKKLKFLWSRYFF
ncbi:ribonuclease P protein component [Buchnera aphidicola]|uniref:ribonuclease P protein component n=1 Tax=Buchnera aphidicola TaxID=9 RepID=UPI002238ACCE|nr:ribonuclease P protein component [Buchnera aphidicola]MCW5197409.1 ribonuclease P protein component [Buchnera aphidicola (Chaitophorus viminalis)]